MRNPENKMEVSQADGLGGLSIPQIHCRGDTSAISGSVSQLPAIIVPPSHQEVVVPDGAGVKTSRTDGLVTPRAKGPTLFRCAFFAVSARR